MGRLNWQKFDKFGLIYIIKLGGFKLSTHWVDWRVDIYIYENGWDGPADVYQLNKRLITLPGTTGADKTKWKCQ